MSGIDVCHTDGIFKIASEGDVVWTGKSSLGRDDRSGGGFGG